MDDLRQLAQELVAAAFGRPGPSVGEPTDANRGRGVFSRVVRVELYWPGGPLEAPASVVIKTPAPGPNGAAAISSGACSREALAYRRVLPASPVPFPHPYLVSTAGESASFVLEDLRRHRHVDQLDGLAPDDAASVAEQLARLHRHWSTSSDLQRLGVRRATPGALSPAALTAGLNALRLRWADASGGVIRAYEELVANRTELVTAFADARPLTLCHGDPRADNLAFRAGGDAVLYDWQQIAVQFGGADLAWLTATSLTPHLRRTIERDLLSHYRTSAGELGWDDYRLGFVLPGLAVLLLAQREPTDRRSERFVATSVARIGTALDDLDVARIRAGSPRD
ncbi:MAG: ecdysteroid 22-kinase family protein [Acidimicrobiia bacterium]|nr:ecdysteroid 22-kinase family protein [Acidimicrobiia bacterium]